MALTPAFPTNPYAILDPDLRWYPGEEVYSSDGYATLLPPFVYRVRQGVKEWRDSRYAGASATTRALLRHWFQTEARATDSFRYYFAQREAVESVIWLYEIEESRDPYALIRYDASGRVSKGMFDEDWTRYVVKMATGSGKTKVMSLLLAWAYFHKRYERDSDLSTNFLLIAPNIIVLDRLRVDFGGLRIFHTDPVLPDNGYEGQNWQDDFQITLHVQDEIGPISDTGNIFLTNIHRVFQNTREPSFEDENTLDYFLGPRPTGKTTDSRLDLGQIVRDVPDLIVMNDEAHHIHDPEMAWFKNLEDISNQLRLKDSKLSAQWDFTATPKHNNGAIFVQTISDYPLVEAIRQGVVKTPVLPDEASRAKLQEHHSAKYTEQYRDYLDLGYLEWRKVYDELAPAGKKSVLFVMTDDTRNCDEVGEFLEATYPELEGAVLVIHTKNNGDISEAATGKSEQELQRLRQQSREIDDADNPYKAIVSVMVLREGWDVQNVVSVVGLRPFKAKSQILPEQALGRGLRRMFRGEDIPERVSVIGTQAFIDFVESIKSEGVELEYAAMGPRTGPQSPLVIEVDHGNDRKDIGALDMDLPVLAPRLYREYKRLDDLDVAALPHPRLPVKQFSEAEQREIVFKDIDTDQVSHTTVLDAAFPPTYQSVIGYFARAIMRDLRLVGGADVLFGKLKAFMEDGLFAQRVSLDDLNVVRNLSEMEVTRFLLETFKSAINALTVQDRGTTKVQDHIKLSKVRPYVVNNQPYLIPKRSVFSKVVAANKLERDFAAFLDGCDDIISFAKNSQSTGFRIEYRTEDGGISNYYPDFLVKETESSIWLIETKGREDLEDPHKWERLQQWCEDATAMDGARRFCALFVREEKWEQYQPRTFSGLCQAFG
jgi:type III restriction enzyme